MKKIVYLFGAGASRNALPIIKEIPARLGRLISVLSQTQNLLSETDILTDFNIHKSKKNLQQELIKDLEWLLAESERHASVDTFAKKLFLKKDFKSLRKLKLLLSIFFICEQSTNRVDSRYDSFYAAILTKDIYNFPNQIRIISWNYDYQFEMAFAEYSNAYELSTNQELLNIGYKHGLQGADPNRFSIFKLNGTTGFYSGDNFNHFQFISTMQEGLTLSIIDELVKNYSYTKYNENSFKLGLSFAWEDENLYYNVVSQGVEAIKDASILVIIGYSFPFFNREIDRKLIGGMSHLEKVYFQAPDAEILLERFKATTNNLNNVELITRYDVDQFLLPNEL